MEIFFMGEGEGRCSDTGRYKHTYRILAINIVFSRYVLFRSRDTVVRNFKLVYLIRIFFSVIYYLCKRNNTENFDTEFEAF